MSKSNDNDMFLAVNSEQHDFIRNILAHDPDAKITIQGGNTDISARLGGGSLHARITNMPLGGRADINFTPSHTRETQSDFEQTIIQRLQSGERQCDVASDVGVSQSRVSQIKKKYLG